MNNFYEQFKELSQSQLDTEFISACENGEIDKVRYLLTSPELPIHADIKAERHAALINACVRNKDEVVKYLLNSDELQEHADLRAMADSAFYKTMNNKNWNLIEYFIFDMNLENDSSIKSWLNIFTKKEEEMVNNMFKTRDLRNELNKKTASTNNKRVKI